MDRVGKSTGSTSMRPMVRFLASLSPGLSSLTDLLLRSPYHRLQGPHRLGQGHQDRIRKRGGALPPPPSPPFPSFHLSPFTFPTFTTPSPPPCSHPSSPRLLVSSFQPPLSPSHDPLLTPSPSCPPLRTPLPPHTALEPRSHHRRLHQRHGALRRDQVHLPRTGIDQALEDVGPGSGVGGRGRGGQAGLTGEGEGGEDVSGKE